MMTNSRLGLRVRLHSLAVLLIAGLVNTLAWSAPPEARPGPATAPATRPPSEPAARLAPGALITVKFPEMPLTFAGAKPQMTIYLPTNYDPASKHPLLIFLNSGNGGGAVNPGVERGLTEDKDFICVSLPLFKDRDSNEKSLIRAGDCKFGWPFYKTMLAKLDETVPNIDPGHRVLGGFSNGAHAAAGLIDQSDGEVARRFSAFLFAEGGGKLERYDLLKGKAFLMVYGSEKSHSRAKEIYEAALAAGAKATLHGMNNVGHAFPATEYPGVREWLRGTLNAAVPASGPGSQPATAPAAATLRVFPPHVPKGDVDTAGKAC